MPSAECCQKLSSKFAAAEAGTVMARSSLPPCTGNRLAPLNFKKCDVHQLSHMLEFGGYSIRAIC
jgi:hypothetical protein